MDSMGEGLWRVHVRARACTGHLESGVKPTLAYTTSDNYGKMPKQQHKVLLFAA